MEHRVNICTAERFYVTGLTTAASQRTNGERITFTNAGFRVSYLTSKLLDTHMVL